MGQIIIPFLEYIILQIAVAVVGLNIIREKEIRPIVVLKSWIFGQMLLFATLQILALPMILLRCHFNVLFWSYTGICVVLFGFGCFSIRWRNCCFRIEKSKWNWLSVTICLIAVVLILWQGGNYLFGMHLDQDDARWLAEANDALEYGNMMTRNYDTGEYLGRFMMPEDASSPWPIMWAIVSRILNIRTSVFAHTIYATVEIFMFYGIYWLMGSEILKKKEAITSFILFVAVFNCFFGGTVYTQSAFSLVRIWQGKASVAAIIIPSILYSFICIHKRNEMITWIRIMITGAAACLMSGMGIFISAFMIGIYGLYYIVAYKNWRRMPIFLATLIPSISSFVVNFLIKG